MMRATTWLLAAGLLVCAGALVVWSPPGWTAADGIVERARDAAGIVNADVEAGGADLYTCSMHPQVLRHEPGDCPICRMDLVPVVSDAPGPAESPGVRANQGFLQSFGVRTTRVERGSLPVAIRTVGALAHNERNVFSVNTKFGGWIERALVNNVGERVTAGEVLFEIYSPDLVTTQHEYLTAMDYIGRLRERDAYDGALLQAASLVDAARARLLYADMTAQHIEALRATRQVSRTVEFVSPASGFIVEKAGDSLEGMRLEPGMTVLKIADHSTLWVEVEFFERDIRHLREGQRVTVTVDAFPGRRWEGAITFFRPAMNPGTRTLTAFVEVDNADLRLRPRMFATVELNAPGAADALIVPADAVLHTGDRAVVVVARGDGYFTPREVRLGLASDGRQQVTEGLDGGEEIVVSSQFLINSESNLKAAIDQLLGDRAEAGSGR